MAEVHGARGAMSFADTAVVFNFQGWVLNTEHDLADVTKLAGVIGTPATGVLMHEYAGLHGNWSSTVEGAIDSGTVPVIAQIIKNTAVLLQLEDGNGHNYQGNAFVRNWRLDNDRFDISKLTVEFQGSGDLTIA